MSKVAFPQSWKHHEADDDDDTADEEAVDVVAAFDRTDALDRFAALFAEGIEEIGAIADEHDATIEDVAGVYELVRNGDQPMIAHGDLADALGLSGPETWAAASVLVEYGELHRAKDGQWWWVHASGYLAELCRERELSLKRYIEMRETLQDCQDAMINWYETRQMHGNLQRRTMGEIKLDFCQRLQKEYWGVGEDEEVVGEETWSDHRVSRYVRTAQDVIVRAYDLTY